MVRTKRLLPAEIPLLVLRKIKAANKRFVEKVLKHRVTYTRDGGHVFRVERQYMGNPEKRLEIVVGDMHIKYKTYKFVHLQQLVEGLPNKKLEELKSFSRFKKNQFKLDKLVEADVLEKDEFNYWYDGQHIVPTACYNWFRVETRHFTISRCSLVRMFAPPDRREELLQEARSLNRELEC